MEMFPEKLTVEIKPRGVLISGLADGESIASVAVDVTSGDIEIDQVQRSGNLVAFVVSGGSSNRGNVIRCEVTTSAGNLYAIEVVQIVR